MADRQAPPAAIRLGQLAMIECDAEGRWCVVYRGVTKARFARNEPTNAADYRNGFNDGLLDGRRNG